MATQNNGLPPSPSQICPYKQKHIASGYIISNKSVNHIVETDLIHINTETHHIYLTKNTTLP